MIGVNLVTVSAQLSTSLAHLSLLAVMPLMHLVAIMTQALFKNPIDSNKLWEITGSKAFNTHLIQQQSLL